MLRFGTISEIDPAKGLARVRFEEDGIVSAWLPIIQRRTLKDKTMETFDIDEHVACLMDDKAEEGVIVGAIFNDKDKPEGGGPNVWARKFEDGTVIKYDRSAKKLTATLASGGTAEITASEVKITGNLVVTGSINGGGAMALEGDLEAKGEVSAKTGVPATRVNLSTHVHPTALPGAPSSPTPGT
ncbi:MAG: phage baseplate assembly protein V [Flavobacteriales bacterium]|jgi:phage baseplate assembly protein V